MVLGALAAAAVIAPQAAKAGDKEDLVAIDVAYQAAVKRNDIAAMEKILHEDFVQVYGDGRLETRAELIAKAKATKYEVQDEDPGTQMVHVFGDAATVTARIWVKGTRADGTTFDRRVWFTDTYVRTPQGWRYAFAQVAN